MEKFHPAMSFTTAVNCVSNVVSPTTMGDRAQQLVNVVECSSTKPVSSLSSGTGCEGKLTGDVGAGSRSEMKCNIGNDDSVSRKLEASLSLDAKQKIEHLLTDIKKLDDKQKLWLYLQLPSGSSEQDPSLKSTSPMLSNCRVEQSTAINWVRSHMEESTDTSLPKQEVYEEYRSFCESTSQKPLSAADFGKVIKSVFPAVQARRLGTRGNSRYCYSGMRKKLELTSPALPPLDAPSIKHGTDNFPSPCPSCPTSLLSIEEDHLQVAAGQVICEWASGAMNKAFANSLQLAQHLTNNKLVSRSSKAILVVQSHMGDGHRQDLTPEMRHKETNYHLKQTLQYRQEIRKKQAEENQQRMQEGASPISSGGKRMVATAEDDITSPHVIRTDKGTQLEQKYAATGVEMQGVNSALLHDGGESSTIAENHMSSSNATVGEMATVASKESPSKRRFAPIQPKTPVRDTSAPLVLLSPSTKNVGGQSVVYVVNGGNGPKMIPVPGISKLTSPQQIVVQGQNIFQSPVQTVATVGNQHQMNVVGNQIVGNTVLSSPVIPAASIQNAIKSGQVLVVGNQMKQVRSVGGGLQPVSNTNAAIRQNPGQSVTPGQVAVVAQAAPHHPVPAVSSNGIGCQKTVLSSQGININTGTSGNARSQTMTPVLLEHSGPGPSVTSPINVMAHAVSNQNAKLVSSSNLIARTAPSSLVQVTHSPTIAASGPSTLTTSVTFATQPMKLLSSVAVIGSDSFQGNCVLSNVSQSGVDGTANVTPQFAVTNPVISSNKHNPLSRPTKSTVNNLPSEICRSNVNSSKTSLIQNGGGKTVASLLRSAQATTSLVSPSIPKASITSTPADLPSGLVLAQVQMPAQSVGNQRDGNVQHILIRTTPDDASSSTSSGGVMMGSQDLATLQQCNLLTKILKRQGTAKQLTVEDAAGLINQVVAQPSVSLLPESESNANPMLMVSGMSAATMLPNRSKPGEPSQIGQLTQLHSVQAISSKDSQQCNSLASALLGKQTTKMIPVTQVQGSQPKMLERLLVSDNLSYISAPSLQTEIRNARSVPTTPIAELQSPPPNMIRAQSAAIPMHQGNSVPPSPSDGKPFAFTPININEHEGEDSPNKPKYKPKPTHPLPRNLLNKALLEVQDQVQDMNSLGKGKGKRAQQSEFVTPTRKRRLSSNSKRLAASSPSSVQFQTQIRQNVASPAPNPGIQQQTILISNSQQNPGMQASSRNHPLNSTFPAGSGHQQQASWQRRRNPSGPACPTISQQTQEELETELMNLLNTSNLQNLIAANKKAMQNRSQSVPLPDHAANRFLQLSQQQNQMDTNRIIIPIIASDQVNQVQEGPVSGFAAKRNLTQDLLDIDVSEEDFDPVNHLLNTEMSSEIDAVTNIQQVSSLNDWGQTNGQAAVNTTEASNVNSQLADFALKYDDLSDQQNGNHSQLAETQPLLPSSQAFNDASNSTASSMSENMTMDDLKMFEGLEGDEGFDLPPTPWQMGTNSSNLSSLECGM